MLKSLRKFLNDGNPWQGEVVDDAPYRITHPKLRSTPLQFWKDENLDSGAVCHWLYYGDPLGAALDLSIGLTEVTPHHYVNPVTVESEMSALGRLEQLTLTFCDTFFEIETRLGIFRAQGFTATADGTSKSCIGFVSRFGDAPLFINGWIGSANAALAAEALDSLSLTGGLSHAPTEAWIKDRLQAEPKAVAHRLTNAT